MPPGITFSCPHCNRRCKVPLHLAGKQGRCPGCKKGLEVPRESAHSSRRAAVQEDPRAASERVRKASGRQASEAATLPKLHDRRCPRCEEPIPPDAGTCPVCEPEPVRRPWVPWQVVLALLLFLPAPLPGMVLAQFGLKAARRIEAYERLAWAAVLLNGLFLIIGTTIAILHLTGRA